MYGFFNTIPSALIDFLVLSVAAIYAFSLPSKFIKHCANAIEKHYENRK